jgi:4-hydroxy-tetrahydrodipicolinate synthase
VLYTNPQFQRSDLSLDTIARLATHPRIRHIKDASTNTGRLPVDHEPLPGDEVFSASAHIPRAVMLFGGVGLDGGPACSVPRQSAASTISAAPGAGRRWRCKRKLWGINEAFARFNLRPASRPIASSRLRVGEPVRRILRSHPTERKIVEKTLSELDGSDQSLSRPVQPNVNASLLSRTLRAPRPRAAARDCPSGVDHGSQNASRQALGPARGP